MSFLRRNLLPELKIPTDWGIEIGILSEMQRNQASNRICQVDLAETYDHKHQDVSFNNDSAGLSRMSIDIIKTLIRKLANLPLILKLSNLKSYIL